MDRNNTHVQSVARAIRMMELLAAERREMSLTEIAKTIGWPKSTVHGLLATLRDYQYVDQSPTTGCYRLGVRLFELGSLVARSWRIRDIALPVMQQLNQAVGETVHLAMEDGGEVLCIAKLDTIHIRRIIAEVGTRLPIHCCGLGKVLLACKRKAEVKWILTQCGMRRMTQHTITDPQALEKELAQICRQGYAIDDRETIDSLRCVAAPIFGKDGCVQYAVSVSALAESMAGEHLDNVIAHVCEAAKNISLDIGYKPEGNQDAAPLKYG